MGSPDPTIALRAGNIGAIGAQNQLNPFEAMRSVVDMQRGMNEIRNQNAQFYAQKLGGEIASQYPTLEQGTIAAMQDPNVAAFAPEWGDTRARMDASIAQAAGFRQTQSMNNLHMFGQTAMAFGAALRRGASDQELDDLWNGAYKVAMANSPEDRKADLASSLNGWKQSIYAGTQDLTGKAKSDKMYANFVNLLPSAGVSPDALQDFAGHLNFVQQGNVTTAVRTPYDGSPAQPVPGGSFAMGAPPEYGVDNLGRPIVRPAVSGGPGGPGLRPGQGYIPPGGAGSTMQITGEPLPGEAGGGPMGNLVGIDRPVVGGPPQIGGPMPAAGAPPTAPTAPPTAPTTPGQPAAPEATAGGHVTVGKPMPTGAETVNYAPPLLRADTTVPNTGDNPLAGNNTPLSVEGTQGQPVQTSTDQLLNKTASETFAADQQAGGAVDQANTAIGYTDTIAKDLDTISKLPPGLAKALMSIGPYVDARTTIAQITNMVDQAMGAKQEIPPQALAAYESYIKTSQQMTINAAKFDLGQSHVAAESIARVNQTFPGGSNSLLGASLVNSINRANYQYFLDRNKWDGMWYDKNQNLLNSGRAFQNKYKPDSYFNEVFRQYGMNPDGKFKSLESFRASLNSGMVSDDAVPEVMKNQFPNE